MKKPMLVFMSLFLIVPIFIQGENDFPPLKGSYLGQKLPGMTPEIFAPGLISTEQYELGSVFSPDLKEFIYVTPTKERGYVLWMMRCKDGVWGKPFEPSFSKGYKDVDPSFSPDGSKIFFCCSNRPGGQGDMDIWYVERRGDGWSEVKNAGPEVNSSSGEVHAVMTATNAIYFRSTRSGNGDIYLAEWINGRFTHVKNLGTNVNSDALDSDCYVDPTESFLIVQSLRQGGYGDSDFYISFRDKGGWSKVVNMGPLINDEKRVLCPAVTPDGKYFFFTRKESEKDGWGNIYWVDAKIIEDLKPKEITLRAQNIFHAIQESNVEEVRKLIKDNHRLIDEIDQDKRTPLHHATQTQNIEIVRLLVECGVKINIKDSRGTTPFQTAIIGQNKEIVELLIKHGADLELEDANVRSPLARVVFWTNNTEMADLLLKYGADINAVSIYDETPLSVAAWLGKREMVNFLIDKGARIKTEGDQGKRLLIYSVPRGLVRLFNELLGKRINLFLRNDTGGNLLHSAAVGGSVEMAKILILKKLLLDEPDRYGWTPMHYAVFRKNKDVVQLLIDEGAKLNKKTYLGKTPLHISIDARYNDVSQILMSNGADQSPYKFPILEGEYLGQKPPGMIPELFAPDIISTNRMEHTSPVFSPDGKEVYWMSLIDVDGSSRHRWSIKTMRMRGKRWSKPEIASFSEDHRTKSN